MLIGVGSFHITRLANSWPSSTTCIFREHGPSIVNPLLFMVCKMHNYCLGAAVIILATLAARLTDLVARCRVQYRHVQLIAKHNIRLPSNHTDPGVGSGIQFYCSDVKTKSNSSCDNQNDKNVWRGKKEQLGGDLFRLTSSRADRAGSSTRGEKRQLAHCDIE